ncbi:MAG TPA: hypothetical protein DD670_01270 [Planctomycetaceae bacterium]|nr:hypothetical protein [Planctomycetaceae bacterium]
MRLCVLFLATVLCLAASARADQFDPRHVSADAQWLAHLDVEALRTTQAADQFLKPWLTSDRAGRELKNIREAIGIDLTNDLHGATLYGVPFEPRRGVVVARANLIESVFVGFLANQPDHKIAKYRNHELHSWTDPHHKGTLFACVCQPPKDEAAPSAQAGSLVVIAHHQADMHKALDVLDGTSPNLAESKSPLASEIRAATESSRPIVTIGVCGLGKADLPLKSPVVRQCETLAMALGEDDGRVVLHARLVADSEAAAADMENVVRGLVALGRLSAESNEAMRKVLDAVTLSIEQRAVVMKWRGYVLDVLQASQQEWIKHNMPR